MNIPENLFQFIVPLTFLAIWALTSLFNREAPPLPPRPGRPQPPGGPGPGLATRVGTGTGAPPAGAPAPNRDPTMRWGPPADRTVTRRSTVVGRPDDEIVIIEETTRRPATPGSPAQVTTTTTIRPAPGAGSGGGSRRGGRPRQAPAASPRRPDPPTPRPLTGTVSGAPFPAAPQSTYLPLDRTPLGMPPSPLLNPGGTRELNRAVSEPSRPAEAGPPAAPPNPTSAEWRLALATPSKLREAIIANEILQPPLALRRRPAR